MAFEERLQARCDTCRRAHKTDGERGRVVTWPNHTQALRDLIAAGWYVDAWVMRCPKHWPHQDEEE